MDREGEGLEEMTNEGTDDYQPDPVKEEAWERLSKAIEQSKRNNNTSENGNGKSKQQQQKEKQKPDFDAFKYSKNGKGPLFEAIILSGRPVFITYENGKIEPYDEIEEDVRVIEPPHSQSYPYQPYEFKNMEEVLGYRERALAENIDSLYQKAKRIAQDYNDQRKEKTNLLATEIISSYFQDLFPTIHYTIVYQSNRTDRHKDIRRRQDIAENMEERSGQENRVLCGSCCLSIVLAYSFPPFYFLFISLYNHVDGDMILLTITILTAKTLQNSKQLNNKLPMVRQIQNIIVLCHLRIVY